MSFRYGEYQISHGNLLIRSPWAPATENEPESGTNLDLHFWGVDYFELPRVLTGIELVSPTGQDVERIGAILGKRILLVKIVVLLSRNRRLFVVADGFKVTENEWDIFESPIEFRSRFRAK